MGNWFTDKQVQLAVRHNTENIEDYVYREGRVEVEEGWGGLLHLLEGEKIGHLCNRLIFLT